MFIDSHAHIDFEDYDQDRDEMLHRAREAGVEAIVNPGSDLTAAKRAAELAAKYEQVYHAVGIHPHEAKDVDDARWAELVELARQTDPVAIGEIGLDYFHNLSPHDAQQKLFRKQLRLSKELNLPIIVHCRDGFEDCLRILDEEANGKPWRGVMHCFSGTMQEAEACLERGFLISFTGMVTFKNAADLRETVAQVPVDRLMLETDSPYLSPVPLRGKRNEPANVALIAEALAEIYGLTTEDIARITSRNTRELFGIGEVRGEGEITYRIRNSLYVNLTNRCSNRCVFCSRESDPTVKGHWLELEDEPTAEEVIAAIGDPGQYAEVTFCGFGEPTIRLEVLKEVAAYVKNNGGRTRLNTNGHADLINGRRTVPELAGLIDVVSVSLNSADRDQYVEICQPAEGAKAYDAMLDFIKDARDHLPKVIVTALDYPGVDVKACRELADTLGVEYRQRFYNEVG